VLPLCRSISALLLKVSVVYKKWELPCRLQQTNKPVHTKNRNNSNQTGLIISVEHLSNTFSFFPIFPPSSLKATHRSFRHASPHLWNQLSTSLRIPHPKYSSPSQRPSFEDVGLTCYTLLSPSITFSLFHSELKTYLFRKSYPPP